MLIDKIQPTTQSDAMQYTRPSRLAHGRVTLEVWTAPIRLRWQSKGLL